MDASRFDTLVRALSTTPSRRAALGALFVGTLGLLGWADTRDAAAKNCKKIKDKKKRKKCLAKARRGDDTPPSDGPRTCSPGCGACHDCANGACVRVADGDPCPNDGNPCTDDVCSGGVCTHPVKANDTRCLGHDQCSGGVCAAQPGCTNSLCLDGCCSRVCALRVIKTPNGLVVVPWCEPSSTGQRCNGDSDCQSGLTCVGYRCSCAAGVDSCQDTESTTCLDNGSCLPPLGGGPTRCAKATPTASCGCTSHAQCQTDHGLDAFCVQSTGTFCTCRVGVVNDTFCAIPV